MKYMGSKRAMLQNGLGTLLAKEVVKSKRFVDLFAGSGAVASHVARKYSIPVIAYDLQRYSVVLSDAILKRRKKIEWEAIWYAWHERAIRNLKRATAPELNKLTHATVAKMREWCSSRRGRPITRAYGGHYYSPQQALWIDALRSTLPSTMPNKTVALAALIQAASKCAAAPGHTAQPFQPTRTAKPFLRISWEQDIVQSTKNSFESLSQLFAIKPGHAKVADANNIVRALNATDLVFIDPPYSGVHYSRFYHVLETIAVGHCGSVTGTGRYPSTDFRPRSDYSVSTKAAKALDHLLKTLSKRRARAIVTFPDHDCSNGLSGKLVRETAAKYFVVREQLVESRFSSLGGTGDAREDEGGRAARKVANELILVLRPKKHSPE
jgi:adenine-specific DNA-methyltransferase